MAEQITEEKFLEDLSNLRGSIEGTNQINLVGISSKLRNLAEKYEGLNSPIYHEFSKYNAACKKALRQQKHNTFDNKQGALNTLDGIMSHYTIHSA